MAEVATCTAVDDGMRCGRPVHNKGLGLCAKHNQRHRRATADAAPATSKPVRITDPNRLSLQLSLADRLRERERLVRGLPCDTEPSGLEIAREIRQRIDDDQD